MSRIPVKMGPAARAEVAAFAGRLESLREARGISQERLSALAGLCISHVSKLESGRYCPSAWAVARLAGVLGVTMDRLWTGTGKGGRA